MILRDLESIVKELEGVVGRLNVSVRLSKKEHSAILIGHAEAFVRSGLWQLQEAIKALEMD